ncbi:helix-turn-helix domain-containing protein [Mucilaginibacter jinjuensis]|uniref:Helix-turn-helix domain-containing protein n=1 Tax=Mucilaginibacter jinjuensis TaxID=1176721 RepID=A0ABY7T360_9SPHI|nr:helix-turn-helix domain-containing protein [Mucilaginibacter jinjuensis]WCT10734.1 helix-turn-helix domain-containing protein [Mucilaginibacter jinjuensis]
MEQQEVIKKKPFEFNNTIADQTQFKVATVFEGKCTLSSYNRRDFYKISLITKGTSELLYADRGIKIDKPVLVFTNPLVPYSWEATDGAQIEEGSGFFCVFTEEFLHSGTRMESLQDSSLFKAGGDSVFFLDNSQIEYIYGIFSRMRQEFDSEYVYKYELMRSQVNLIIHEAIKMQPAIAYATPQNAASRITKLFLSLLDKQFPVDSPRFALKLKKAGDYASRLAVHVNHLNAAVQEVTGKSTTTHINEKILSEARSLLTHTDWSVAEIAFSLGFEYASYFNNFFKKHTGYTPLSLRKTL